jgi:hypothetical protein
MAEEKVWGVGGARKISLVKILCLINNINNAERILGFAPPTPQTFSSALNGLILKNQRNSRLPRIPTFSSSY